MELALILVIVVILFGAGRMADLGSSLGKGIREFRKAVREDEPISAKETNEPK
jgi:sec-independent protein translocase protein TatA